MTNELGATWIPITERLPKFDEKVLITMADKNIIIGYISPIRYEHEGIIYKYLCINSKYYDESCVLAWTYLPKAYEKGKEE